MESVGKNKTTPGGVALIANVLLTVCGYDHEVSYVLRPNLYCIQTIGGCSQVSMDVTYDSYL
jgi:hypothetical protein